MSTRINKNKIIAAIFLAFALFSLVAAQSDQSEQGALVVDIAIELELEDFFVQEFQETVQIVGDINVVDPTFYFTIASHTEEVDDFNKDNSINPYIALYKDDVELSRNYFIFMNSWHDELGPVVYKQLTVPLIEGADNVRIFFNNEEKFRLDLNCRENDCDNEVCYALQEDGICDFNCHRGEDLDCSPEKLCDNGALDKDEVAIDCGGACGVCSVDRELLLKTLKEYDAHRISTSKAQGTLMTLFEMIIFMS